MPISESLSEMGGSVQIKEVLNSVYRKIKGKLNEHDHRSICSSPYTPHWYNGAQWCRYAMIKDGLIKSDSPPDTWEISDEEWQKPNNIFKNIIG